MTSKVWAILPSVLEDIDTEKKAVLQNAAFLNALLPQVRHTETTVRNGVAVISIEGAVYRKKSWFMPGMTHKQIKNEIEKALRHDEVKAIFYNIYSPGGTVAGTQELASFIKEAAAIKPSCAFVDGMCCSAAYWLASATGRIFATQSAELGSIGVVLKHADASKFLESAGVKYTHITAGSKKSVGASETPLSEDDKMYLQNQVNGIYDVFLQETAQNMGLDLDKKLEWADGRVFLGREAAALGLVSKIVKTKEEAMSCLLENIQEKTMAIPNMEQKISHEQTSSQQTVSTISEDLFAIIETVCGADNAEKVKTLAESGLTKAQVEALGSVISVKTEQKNAEAVRETNRQILAALVAASPDAVTSASKMNKATDDEQTLIERIGNMKG